MKAEQSEDGSSRASWLWRIYVALGILGIGVYFTLSGAARDSLYDLFSGSAAVVVLFGAYLHRPRRRLPWLLISAGLFIFAAGDITYNIYQNVLHRPAPFPS